MNERENLLKVLNHEQPEWPPVFIDGAVMIGGWGPNENGVRGEMVDDGIALDCFGCKWDVKILPAPYMKDFLLDDVCDWREVVKFPDLDSFDWPAYAEHDAPMTSPDKLTVFHSDQGPFDRLCTLMGFENALIALMEEPEECANFFQAVADHKIKIVKAAKKYYGAEAFVFTDDVANATGMFMQPAVYREIIKPAHARVLKAIKDEGMIPIMHICGDFEEILPDIIKMGAAAEFPSQPCGNLERMLEQHGHEIAFIGGFASQGPAGRESATEELVREEARRLANEYATKSGFIAFPMCGIGLMNEVEILHTGWFMDEYKKECARLGL